MCLDTIQGATTRPNRAGPRRMSGGIAAATRATCFTLIATDLPTSYSASPASTAPPRQVNNIGALAARGASAGETSPPPAPPLGSYKA